MLFSASALVVALFAAGADCSLYTSSLSDIAQQLVHSDQQLVPGDNKVQLSSGGVTRSAVVHLPKSAAPGAAPLIIDFHALGSTDEEESVLDDLRLLSSEHGVVVAFPEGYARATFPLGLGGFSFNGGGCCPDANSHKVDDVQFTKDLVDFIQNHTTIDQKRVYATGMSNGGFMVNRVACELSDVFAAVAPVSGVLDNNGTSDIWKSDHFQCEPKRAMPLLHFHGTADTIVPYHGNGILGFNAVSVDMDGWTLRNGCKESTPRVTFQNNSATCTSLCSDPAKNVTLCAIKGSGHSWPGARGFLCPTVGPFKCNHDITATEHIWEFFSRYTL